MSRIIADPSYYPVDLTLTSLVTINDLGNLNPVMTKESAIPSSFASFVHERRRWIALIVVCFAMLMNILDQTIVNVALPTIQRDLHFSQASLAWVIDAYLITFAGTLLLAGRLGDLIGRKKVFLVGVALFTAASIACGAADSQILLISARFVQGLGAALSSSVILAIIVADFPIPRERAKAMSSYIIVAVGGGSLGLLVGGYVTQALSWHWIFFINIPIGVATFLAGVALIEENTGIGIRAGLDIAGAILSTAGLMLAVYAIVSSSSVRLELDPHLRLWHRRGSWSWQPSSSSRVDWPRR